MGASNNSQPTTPEMMLAFYRRLYPFKSIFAWLNHEHAPTKLFTHREFAFTLQGDVYLRYHSFNSAEELKKEVCRLNPTRFEVGAVYSSRVSGFWVATSTQGKTAKIVSLCHTLFSLEIRRYCALRISRRSFANSCSISI